GPVRLAAHDDADERRPLGHPRLPHAPAKERAIIESEGEGASDGAASGADATTARQDRRNRMLKLFYSPGSCALASHVALEEAGAQYEAVRLDFRANEQRKPEYLKINPKGRVPALATDRGVLTETPAILAFVAQSFPQARLAPLDDPFAFGR